MWKKAAANYLLSSLLPLTVVLASGCATVIGTETRFVPWSGQLVAQGSGGAVESVDGIEIWSHGTPEQKYRVIGIVEQSKSDEAFENFVFGRFNRSEIAAIVKKAGGNGVVTLKTERTGAGETIQSKAVMAVFRYK